MKLEKGFYTGDYVLLIAKLLLGKVLFTCLNNEITAGIISETEAYAGINDRASHAYGNRKTERTSIMYKEGGIAYIYLCYGIHSLFNVVTNVEGIPHAVLIRSIIPYEGKETMLKRRKIKVNSPTVFTGPGNVSKALGLDYSQSGTSLLGNLIWIEDKGIVFKSKQILKTPRIGVDYAGSDALLPYRFIVKKIENVV